MKNRTPRLFLLFSPFLRELKETQECVVENSGSNPKCRKDYES